MTPQRRLEIEQHANLYGSANGWAGTSGTLATMIRELLAEIDRLKVDRMVKRYIGVGKILGLDETRMQ